MTAMVLGPGRDSPYKIYTTHAIRAPKNYKYRLNKQNY